MSIYSTRSDELIGVNSVGVNSIGVNSIDKGKWNIVHHKHHKPYKSRYGQSPITSYGIILFTILNNEILYLTAQRRDTIEYVDFIRGQYNYKNIRSYFSLMSQEERDRITKYTFDELWKDLWINRQHRIYKECYSKAKDRFKRIQPELENILKETNTETVEPQWIFPKGKKNSRETPIDCAVREFKEETRMNIDEIDIISEEPFIETFKGSNGKSYSTHYYIAYANEPIEIKTTIIDEVVRKNKHTVSEEISHMEWLTLENAKKKLNNRRCNMLNSVDKLVRSYLTVYID